MIYENFLINLDMNLKLFSKLKFISLKGKKKHGQICDELNEYMGCNGSETNFVKKNISKSQDKENVKRHPTRNRCTGNGVFPSAFWSRLQASRQGLSALSRELLA